MGNSEELIFVPTPEEEIQELWGLAANWCDDRDTIDRARSACFKLYSLSFQVSEEMENKWYFLTCLSNISADCGI